MPGCPHTDIRFCPLYLAAHDCQGLGCDDGRLGEGGCAVDRGLNYATAVARLCPREVAQAAWRASAEEHRAQIARNMRAAGLH